MPLPFGQNIEATIVGGVITVGDMEFPLGEDAPGDNGERSTIRASIDGDGLITAFEFDFQPAEQDLDGIQAVIQLAVTNQGDLRGRLTQDNDDGTIAIPGDTGAPSGIVNAEISSPVLQFPGGCGLLGIEIGELSGGISGDGPPNVATLATGTFQIPATTSCGAFNDAVNNFLSLPAPGTSRFELEINWPRQGTR